MIKTGFFNSINDDRTYKAEMFAEYFSSFIGNGIFPNPSTNLQVLSNSGMNIIIKPGKAWINGYYVHNDSDYTVKLDVADGVLKRIDRVVLRLSMIDREIQILVKKGAFASNPSPPQLIRDVEYYELAIADVLINNGATQITQANITDTRLNNALCGVVHGTVNQVDTTTIFNQFKGWFDEFSVEKEQEVQQFIDDLKSLLDGDVASNLVGRLVTLENEKLGKNEIAAEASKSYALANVRMIDGVAFDATADVNRFGVCNTAAATQVKEVTINRIYDYLPGLCLRIKFTNGNTHANPQIKATQWHTAPILTNEGKPFVDIKANGVYTFVFDGTAFILQGETGVSVKGLIPDGFVSRAINTSYRDLEIIKATDDEMTTLYGDLSYIRNVRNYNKQGDLISSSNIVVGTPSRSSENYNDKIYYIDSGSANGPIYELDIVSKISSIFMDSFLGSGRIVSFTFDGHGYMYVMQSSSNQLIVVKINLSSKTVVSNKVVTVNSDLSQVNAKIKCKGDYLYISYDRQNGVVGIALINIDDMSILVNDAHNVGGSVFNFIFSDVESDMIYVYGNSSTRITKLKIGNTTGSWTSSQVYTLSKSNFAIKNGYNLGDDLLAFIGGDDKIYTFDAINQQWKNIYSTGKLSVRIASDNWIGSYMNEKELIVCHDSFPYSNVSNGGAGFMFYKIHK